MMFWLLGFVTGAVGALPLFIFRKPALGVGWGVAGTLIATALYYMGTPSLAYPLGGWIAALIIVYWIVSAALCDLKAAVFPALGVVIVLVTALSGGGCFNAGRYAGMIGGVEKREWTQDVQPKDPRHVRLVSDELARWLADKQLGEAPGAIGSQFQISDAHATLQLVKGELWYVFPLDYKGFAVWTSTPAAPGYVMVHGENPFHPVVVRTSEKFVYTPGAFFDKNLERHLWNSGYYAKGLTDYSLELDDDGKAWWVVTVYEPSISYFAPKVLGAVIVDPETGAHTYHALGSVPKWVDRIVPGGFVERYITWQGEYALGWWNSFWDHKDITKPDEPNIAYGADGDPYWVTGITSSSDKDQALVGLMYTNSRTGKSTLYHAVGGTDKAILQAVNNKVKFREWHGTNPVLYNIYGVMSAIVPVLGVNHTFQGVAIVRVDNLQVAFGEDPTTAAREFQKLMASGGAALAPELTKDKKVLRGKVDRAASEVKSQGGTMYYIHIEGVPHLFTGASEISPKLPLTKAGDEVEISYIASGEDVEPLLAFDNLSLPLRATALQRETQEKAAERKAEADAVREERSLKGEMRNMDKRELQEFKEFREQKKRN